MVQPRRPDLAGARRRLDVRRRHPGAARCSRCTRWPWPGSPAHSGYKGDPWGRLQRTSDFLATTTFGTVEHAEAAIARVRAIHERVRGTAPDGRPYAASDPHLLRWVHVTEVDSFLAAYQRFGERPLTAAGGRPVRRAGRARGDAARGRSTRRRRVAELREALEAYRPELGQHAGGARGGAVPAARPAAAAAAPGRVMPAWPPPRWPCCPRWSRVPLRLPWLPVTERLVGLPVGSAATRLIRWAMTAPPGADQVTDRSTSRAGDARGPRRRRAPRRPAVRRRSRRRTPRGRTAPGRPGPRRGRPA